MVGKGGVVLKGIQGSTGARIKVGPGERQREGGGESRSSNNSTQRYIKYRSIGHNLSLAS